MVWRQSAITGMVWGLSLVWYGDYHWYGMGTITGMVWGLSLVWYGDSQLWSAGAVLSEGVSSKVILGWGSSRHGKGVWPLEVKRSQ